MVKREQSRLVWSLAALKRVSSKDDLKPALAKIRDIYKFAHLVFVLVRPHGRGTPLYCTTYPDEWTSLYLRRNYLDIDPVIQLWNAGSIYSDWSGLDLKSARTREFFKEAKSYGVGRNGVTIAVRGPNGERSLISATSNLPRLDWRKLRSSTDNDLLVLSQYLHEKVLTVSGTRTQAGHRPLSRREQECLQHLANGMVPKRVASKLKISESAVRLYLRSARRKLETATIYQAIARASFCEVIQLQ